MADALAKVSSHVFGWGQINLQVRRLASWKQHRQMESCQHQFWEGTHILETKVKLSIVTHGAAVPWPSWNIEKVRNFSHSEKRMAEELKLDKGTDSSWKELWTGEKFYTSTIQLEWWRETIKSWHLFLTFILRRQMKQYMLRYKKLTWDAVWYWRRVSTLANIYWIIEKAREFRKTSTSASLTKLKPLTVGITTNWGKFFKRWKYQTTFPAS